MQILDSRILCCGSNRQIHTDYRNPVEKKGRHGHSLNERGWEGQREPKEAQPLPGQAFIAFLGTLHQGWSSFTMHRFTVGDYLLRTTKDRMLLITSKRRILQLKGESGWTGYTLYLGGLAQTLGSEWYSVNICYLNTGWGSFSKSKSHISLGTMQAWFPMGEPVRRHGSCPPTSLPTGILSGGWTTFPTVGMVPHESWRTRYKKNTQIDQKKENRLRKNK